ncbi:MAG: hypothetical protein AAFY24_13680 [Pseudomonadota bacterium]
MPFQSHLWVHHLALLDVARGSRRRARVREILAPGIEAIDLIGPVQTVRPFDLLLGREIVSLIVEVLIEHLPGGRLGTRIGQATELHVLRRQRLDTEETEESQQEAFANIHKGNL